MLETMSLITNYSSVYSTISAVFCSYAFFWLLSSPILTGSAFVTMTKLLNLSKIVAQNCDKVKVKIQKYYYQQILYFPYRVSSYVKKHYLKTKEERKLELEAAERGRIVIGEIEERLRAADAAFEENQRLQYLKVQEDNVLDFASSIIVNQVIPSSVLQILRTLNSLDFNSLIPARPPAPARMTFRRRNSIYGEVVNVVQPYPNADNLFDHLPQALVLPLRFTEYTFDCATSVTAAGIKFVFRL